MPQSKRRNGRDQHVADLRYRGAVLLGGTAHPVRTAKGGKIPCVYGECWADGDSRYRIERRNRDAPDPNMPGGKVIEIFCSERHRDMRIAEQQHIQRRGPLGNRT